MLLEVKGLSKKYYSGFLGQKTVDAVKDISFAINEGEILGLMGGSGCGKTTVAKIVLGLLRPTCGSVLYCGQDLTSAGRGTWRSLRKEIQAIFQHPQAAFNPRRNIYFSCVEPIRLYKMAKEKTEEEMVCELIQRIGLSKDQLKKYPHEISGGQAQRLAIIRALSLRPRLLICDEPTSMLDVSVQAQVLDLLLNIHKEQKLSMLYISHDLDVVRAICSRVAVMRQGRIVEIGTSQEIFENPRHEYTKHLLSSRM